MPYIIAFVIIIVAAGALLLFRQPVDEPVTGNTDVSAEEANIESETQNNVPEGFTPPTTPPPAAEEDEMSSSESEADATETYTAEAAYFTPNRTEHEMEVTLDLKGETVVGADVVYNGGPAQTPQHTSFDEAYLTQVIGQDINNVQLSRVGGSSLTSAAFNEAVEDIKQQM